MAGEIRTSPRKRSGSGSIAPASRISPKTQPLDRAPVSPPTRRTAIPRTGATYRPQRAARSRRAKAATRNHPSDALDLGRVEYYGHAMSGLQKGAYQAWRVLVALIAVACVVQIFLAGRGAFGIHGAAKLDDQKSFDAHRALGEVIGLLAVLALLVASVAWRDKRVIWLTLALAVMAEILQHLFALPKHPWVAGTARHSTGVAILGSSRGGSRTRRVRTPQLRQAKPDQLTAFPPRASLRFSRKHRQVEPIRVRVPAMADPPLRALHHLVSQRRRRRKPRRPPGQRPPNQFCARSGLSGDCSERVRPCRGDRDG